MTHSQLPQIRFRFYLGHNKPNGGKVGIAQATELVALVYPSGFAVFEGSGRWLDVSTGYVVSEGSTVYEVLVPNESGLETLHARDLAERLATVFEQDAVLLTAEEVPVVEFVKATKTNVSI